MALRLRPSAVAALSDPRDAGQLGRPVALLSRAVPGMVAYVVVGGANKRPSVRVSSGQAALMVAVMIGCGAGACVGASTGGTSVRNPNLISLTEIDQAREDGLRDLYELIDRSRPRWLQGRTPRSLQLQTVIAVYHHETLLGGIDVLRGYPLISVTSVRYLDAAQAMLLPGAGSMHVEGAIVISTAVVPDSGSARLPIRLLEGGV